MRIDTLTDADARRWDAYVEPRTWTVTDMFAWRLVAKDAYGIRSHFLLAVDGKTSRGALALFEIKHAVFGHYLATSLFGTDGGFHYDDDASRDALLEEAIVLAAELGVSHMVIRTRGASLGMTEDMRFRTAVLDLKGTPAEMLERLESKTRNQVRRGEKEGFTIAFGPEQIPAFHQVFHEHMRGLGSPAHSLAYYKAIATHLGDTARFFVVRDKDRLVGGALLTFANGTSANLHTVTLPEYNPRCPNYLLYWRMIVDSYHKKCHSFDMGRSEIGSSQLAFKGNWSPRIEQLRYSYFMPMGGLPPRIDPKNPKYRLAISAWRRMPLFVTRALGPRLISGIA